MSKVTIAFCLIIYLKQKKLSTSFLFCSFIYPLAKTVLSFLFAEHLVAEWCDSPNCMFIFESNLCRVIWLVSRNPSWDTFISVINHPVIVSCCVLFYVGDGGDVVSQTLVKSSLKNVGGILLRSFHKDVVQRGVGIGVYSFYARLWFAKQCFVPLQLYENCNIVFNRLLKKKILLIIKHLYKQILLFMKRSKLETFFLKKTSTNF